MIFHIYTIFICGLDSRNIYGMSDIAGRIDKGYSLEYLYEVEFYVSCCEKLVLRHFKAILLSESLNSLH